ncbi:MAG: hypothetical protein ACRDHF_00550 [Tepidiformaceae bacterium]
MPEKARALSLAAAKRCEEAEEPVCKCSRVTSDTEPAARRPCAPARDSFRVLRALAQLSARKVRIVVWMVWWYQNLPYSSQVVRELLANATAVSPAEPAR